MLGAAWETAAGAFKRSGSSTPLHPDFQSTYRTQTPVGSHCAGDWIVIAVAAELHERPPHKQEHPKQVVCMTPYTSMSDQVILMVIMDSAAWSTHHLGQR